jgi:hypothetical protein
MQGKHVNVIEEVRERLRMWTDPDVLISLILQLRQTICLHDDAIRAVLIHLRDISLDDALQLTGARAVVTAYTFPRSAVWPSPESPYSNFYYLSQQVMEGHEEHLIIVSKSHWRGTNGNDLCYVMRIALADVSMSLDTDGEHVNINVARVYLMTNVLSHGELSEDCRGTISRLRLAAVFDKTGDVMHVSDTHSNNVYGFGMRIAYEALCQ